MKAVLMTQQGNPDVLQLADIGEPEISTPSEVKIRLKAAGVNPIDTKIRSNGLFYQDALPAVLGCDGAGEVVEIGSGVVEFQPGDEVWFFNGGLGKEQGNYAEYTVIDARWITAKPKSRSFADAAASPLVLITAWEALYDRGNLQEGQNVLIHAGAGGVGHVAIQLAKIKGARVITTVSDEEKAGIVKALGADDVILYTKENFASRVNHLTGGKGADLVFDTVGPEVFKDSIDATAYGGSLVTILDPGELGLAEARMRNLKICFELMLTPMLRGLDSERDKQVEILTRCAEWMDLGKLKVLISHKMELSQAIVAHKLIEQGHIIGKIVLEN